MGRKFLYKWRKIIKKNIHKDVFHYHQNFIQHYVPEADCFHPQFGFVKVAFILNTIDRGKSPFVCPIMTYGTETRAATTKTKQLLRTTEMNTARAILGKTRFDRMKNVDILERCNLQEVVKFVKGRRKAWNEHVSRAEQRLIKLVRDARPNTKRPPK